MRVCLWGIISLAVTKRAASSDLAPDAITNMMVWAIERTAPLKCRNGSFSERKMCAPVNAAGVSLIEKSCIRVGTQDHVTSSMDDAIRRKGSNII